MSLNFFPTPQEDEQQIREITQAFVNTQLRPTASEDDKACHFRREIFNELAALGLNCVSMPEPYGGKGLSYRCQYACVEELARGSVSIAITVGVTNLTQGGILAFGTEAQKKKYLTPLLRGEWIGAFSLSEPHSGSDAASLICSAKKVEGGYQLNGTKMWCSTIGHADLYLVMARTSEHKTRGITAFLVPATTPGFRPGKEEEKLGLCASSLGELIFEDCFIPTEQRLGEEGEGLKVALSQLDAGRITIGAAGAAIATEAIERAWSHFTERAETHPESFPLYAKTDLAQLFAELQALRNLITTAATLKDRGAKVSLLASQTKLLGSDLAMKAASQAITLLGPQGCQREVEIERLFRDAKALQIVEGTNQIQKLVIAREMENMLNDH